MNPQIATTKEQSARLIACGVKPETADMCWEPQGGIDNPTWVLTASAQLGRIGWGGCKPAWSLSALIHLLPRAFDFGGYNYLFPTITWDSTATTAFVQYFADKDYEILQFYADSTIDTFTTIGADSAIEACVKAIEWLAKNGFRDELGGFSRCQTSNAEFTSKDNLPV